MVNLAADVGAEFT